MANVDKQALRKKLIDNILLRLGGGMIDVEIDSDSLNHCIDLALMQLKQRGDACYEKDLVLLTLKRDTKVYTLPEQIIYIQQIYRRGFGRFGATSGMGMDPFSYAWSNVYTASLYGAGQAGAGPGRAAAPQGAAGGRRRAAAAVRHGGAGHSGAGEAGGGQ